MMKYVTVSDSRMNVMYSDKYVLDGRDVSLRAYYRPSRKAMTIQQFIEDM